MRTHVNKGSAQGKIWVRRRNKTGGMFKICIGYPDLILPIYAFIYQAREALAIIFLLGIIVCFFGCDGAISYASSGTRYNKRRVTICETSRGSTYIGGHDACHICHRHLYHRHFYLLVRPTDFDTRTSTTNDPLIQVRFTPQSPLSQLPMPATEMVAMDSVRARKSVQFR